ncbi:MAG TPA: Na+/H+ antiporter [Acidimicrobiales bacterium]|nr:Na+/H+ antiporter [Acidimicrobiales bacterium]
MISIADGLGLLIGIVVIATIADRLRIAYPILLVIAGIGVALIPIHHRIELQPDLVLLVFLPPLIYDASLDTSAGELRAHLRPILLLAVGLVLATMVSVAVVIHSVVGGMSWAVAFALGAIVSPPDSVAATQIAGKLGLPRRLVTILGGEGLMNDATALTAYQVAIAAVGSAFTVLDVFGKFAFAVVVGVAIGIAVGWIGSRMLRFTETPVIENTMLLILPFAAYLPADKVGASGVLAVVATGLYFGRYGSGSLTAAARLQQRQIWDLVVFLLTGMSFLLIGLELRPILDSLTNRESGSLVIEGLAVVGIVIAVRMAWMFAATALPGGQRLFGAPPLSGRSWRETTVVGWAGMRGAVSLAASLALPQSFPHRDLLVFLTFAVIVATLVGQGLTLPPLIRRLGLVTRDEQDMVLVTEARRRLTVSALSHLDGLARTDQFPPEVVDRIRIGYEAQLGRIDRRLDVMGSGGADGDGSGDGDGSSADAHGYLRAERELRRLVIGSERTELDLLVARRKISERVADGVRGALDVDETTMRP